MNNVENRLSDIIAECCKKSLCNWERSWIKKDINLVNDIGLDSLSLINMIVEVETEFGIEFSGENLNIKLLSNLQKLKEIICLELKKNEAGS